MSKRGAYLRLRFSTECILFFIVSLTPSQTLLKNLKTSKSSKVSSYGSFTAELPRPARKRVETKRKTRGRGRRVIRHSRFWKSGSSQTKNNNKKKKRKSGPVGCKGERIALGLTTPTSSSRICLRNFVGRCGQARRRYGLHFHWSSRRSPTTPNRNEKKNYRLESTTRPQPYLNRIAHDTSKIKCLKELEFLSKASNEENNCKQFPSAATELNGCFLGWRTFSGHFFQT